MNKTFIRLILKRILSSLVLVFLLITLLFFLVRIAPGNPLHKYISPEVSAEVIENLKAKYALDENIFVQYVTYIKNIFIGDFGNSYNYKNKVTDVIFDFLPFTIVFASICFLVQLIISVPLALFVKLKLNKKWNNFINRIGLFIYSIPSFIIAVLLIYIFALNFNLLPSSGVSSFNNSDLSFINRVWDYISHMILPVISGSIAGTVIFYNYLRENLDQIYDTKFILYLRSIGKNEKQIFINHVLPNAMGPIISISAIELGILFSGVLITEVIFALPGFGRLMMNAVMLRDYPLILGCALTSASFIILFNLLADVARAFIDKRLIKKIV